MKKPYDEPKMEIVQVEDLIRVSGSLSYDEDRDYTEQIPEYWVK